MNADRYQQVKQVFLAACDLEPSRVAAFLDQACAADAELRQEVESLLHYHQAATVSRASPEVAPLDTARLDPFPPGKILAGRYRILAPLGRGGMGDVYRADDLTLGQPVALKFLARSRSQAPAWLNQYRNEVRLALKVTHVNVLRVYDIGEADGEVFISMEYVDGEDLGALLRRVGRLTSEKAIEVARQLCSGLGAAHDRGVLHRDLKPANIMIDGRGQVRIADFGIASLVTHAESTGSLVGTPAYMAPELFGGGKPSVRSDLFSLGVVLYEAIVGKPPFEGRPSGFREPGATVVRPSATVTGVDPGLEKVICQCLEQDPSRRPDSAHAVARALPGGDPLAEALAKGETPSPSMIAAADAKWRFPASAAIGCLAIAAVALLFVIRQADRAFFLPRAGLTKPPAVLAERAENILAAIAGEPGNKERWQGFTVDRGFLEYAMATENRSAIWDRLPDMSPPAVYFWYRAGSRQVTLPTLLNDPSPNHSLPTSPNAITVRLDGQGRLVRYAASPGAAPWSQAASAPMDWSSLFELAGLQLSDFRPVRPERAPPMYVDSLTAWEEASPKGVDSPLRVEGGAAGGRIVFFNLVPPWEQDQTEGRVDPTSMRRLWCLPVVHWLVYLVGMIGGGLLAWHNIDAGRGDLRGASKLAALAMLVGLLDWLLGEDHAMSLVQETASLYLWTARATLTAAVVWVCYVAVEPYVRRYWPDSMITWTRVLQGRLRDPLVGRDILIGGMCGVLLVLVMQLDTLLPSWLGWPASTPKFPRLIHDLGDVLGLRYKMSIVVASIMSGITVGLLLLLLLLMVRVVLRPAWLAIVVSWLLLTVLQSPMSDFDVSFPWLVASIYSAVVILLLSRVGLGAMIVNLFCSTLLINSPITADPRAWYAPSGTSALALVAALLVWAMFTARAGQPTITPRPVSLRQEN